LRAALTHVPAHFAPRGGGAGGPTCAVFATNGEILLAAGLGRPLYLQTVGGIAECARCEDALNLGPARRRTVAHAHVKAFLVSDSPLQSTGAETNPELSTLPAGTLLDISVAADVCTVPLSE